MSELSDQQKLQYFDGLVKTLRTIRDSANKPVFGDQVTMRFIHGTSDDMLRVISGVEETNDARRNDRNTVEKP
jgi:hypothetical protein